ncbi:uncharacterized protein [Medicago truncatula]|uniref:mTERF protein n=2 Tax=Medicago truncatula TaxID=3880 RepID=A0A072V635_MEDTR|nr:uncharacterized protein LOC25488151 [Medicago truncatula]KEH37282.1 mTERF protein [Medicago truncatula]
MFTTHRRTTLLYLKTLTFSPSPKNPLPFSHYFSTNTSDSTFFAVSYLINNFGFSPQFASKLSSTYNVHFKTARKPDSVLNFFRNHGFSDSQIRTVIAKEPRLLSCDPLKRVLPKFQFFLSKGASNSDIVNIVSKNPMFLTASLDKKIVPTYELVYKYLQSDKHILALLNCNPTFFGRSSVEHNIRLLIQSGVTDINIARLLRNNIKFFMTGNLPELVKELKDLGFHPSQSIFSVALIAKTYLSKSRWNEKVDVFKKWGWSDEDVREAFKKQPQCMLTSIDKINSVMNFWVNQLGWDALAIAKTPRVLGASLERRIIPRASVVEYLLKRGLHKKEASLTSPFIVIDKTFYDMYINRFKEESSYLLKLYEENLNLAQTKEKTGMI